MNNNPNLIKIRERNPALADKIYQQAGFVTDEDLPKIIEIDRLMLLLVRCGNGRFLAPAQDVAHFVGIIEEHAKLKQEKTGTPMQGDHIRDVSIPSHRSMSY
jgi:hypothetical protein